MTYRSAVRPRLRVVMFVDPRPDVRARYCAPLRDSGFLVDEVTSLEEAVALAPRTLPDLVVLAREVEGGERWDVARHLKADDETRDAPIVAFAPYEERGDIERALVAGCDSFVPESTEPAELVRHARGLLGMSLQVAQIKRVEIA